MISCHDADVLAAALSVGSIEAADQSELHGHLAGCADCTRVAGEYMAAASRLPLALEPLKPSPELRGRLMRAVYAEAAQARPAGAQLAWWRRLWEAVPASRALTAIGAAAAVVVVGLASWAVLSRQGGPSAPGSTAVALVAGPSAPHAHGLLTYQPGSGEAVLTATGLPNPGTIGGRAAVYEVWLIRPSGVAVAASYLSQDPDGSWSAALRGDMSAYSAVAATAEPAGGSTAPTGAKVIEGPLPGR